MAQCLLIENRSKIASLYILNLRVYVGVDIIWKKTYEEALEVIRVCPNIDLIITRAKLSPLEKAKPIYDLIRRSIYPSPLIILGKEARPPKNAIVLETDVDVETLTAKAAKILGVTPGDMALKVMPEYFRIPIRYLRYMTNCPSDVFLKVGNDDINPRYLKIIETSESYEFPKDVLQKYMFKGVETFYILSVFRIDFVQAFTKQLLNILTTGGLSFQERVEVNDLCYAFVSDEALNPEFTNEVCAVSLAAIQSVSSFTKALLVKKPEVIIQQLIDEDTSYRYRMAQLIHILSYLAISQLEWITEEQEQKIAYVAFMHDILLKSDELAMILDREEFENAKLTNEETKLVENHALWTMDFVGGFPSTQFDVNVLIKQHHGISSGVGFPDGYNNYISPLAILFIVCERYAKEILEKNGRKFNHKEIAENLYDLNERSKYRAVLTALGKSFANE